MATIVASFTSNIVQAVFPASIQFTDTSTGNPTKWFWDFGDGTSSDSQNPLHVYQAQGVYSVKLKAWNNNGSLVSNGDFVTSRGKIRLITTTINGLGGSPDEDVFWTEWIGMPVDNWGSGSDFGVNYRHNLTGVLWSSWGRSYGGNKTEVDIDLSSYDITLHICQWTNTLYGASSTINGTFGQKAVKQGFNAAGIGLDGVLTKNTDGIIVDLDDFIGQPKFENLILRDSGNYSVRYPSIGAAGNSDHYSYSHSTKLELWAFPSDTDFDTVFKPNFITVNDNVILRPPVLFSGIKEAYFKDGWENEKHIYIEQSKAQPCTIQFVDIYADTENE
ncbi:hypothetical protein LCGC14_0820380 [marine sediment metagenome]|uniref:PKD domain-containing protein n=1 Tax=marine sediment metagenome TaxID=412755 RepID=A0A0F9PJ07_9ZZZZ